MEEKSTILQEGNLLVVSVSAALMRINDPYEYSRVKHNPKLLIGRNDVSASSEGASLLK